LDINIPRVSSRYLPLGLAVSVFVLRVTNQLTMLNSAKIMPDYNFQYFCALHRCFISAIMITQLAAYGSFISFKA
jgi:hypothetical protein